MLMRKVLWAAVVLAQAGWAREIHVSVKGSDGSAGTAASPLRTISAAAAAAMPGDVITVHEGTYRERVTPPRGGESEARRIVYQAAKGEKVVIKGSEVVRDWKLFAPGVWKATVPNSLFGKYNPYKDKIWGDWFTDRGRPHHTGEVYLNGKSLWESHLLERVLNPQPVAEARDREGSTYTWFAESDEKFTYIYANFHDKDPNRELVEINVRDACFYPDQPGRDYITVRGFELRQAATQWAAPTAEQIGLVGTHWSKGWIIENNTISDSKCSCVTLGKERKTGHNVWVLDPKTDGATHYNQVIERALAAGWSRENIGSHIVRDNVIFNCEQAGIAGSMGAVYSTITNNHIYNVWTKRQFTGAEMGGIKLHGAIDVLIANNRIHNTGRGLWMDWMAQGTRITANLLYDNSTDDLFVEVNHGPFLIDNNIFLSPVSLRDWSQGGAYVHNLLAGSIVHRQELKRSTPYLKPHATALGGLSVTKGGDNRFYNNLLAGEARNGLPVYEKLEMPTQTGGNVEVEFKPEVLEEGASVYLRLRPGAAAQTQRVNTALLGKARISGQAFENPDGSPLAVDRDYFGKPRGEKPAAGPFENPGTGELKLKVW